MDLSLTPSAIERARRRLDAEALELYQDESRSLWFTPVARYSDFEQAAQVIASELRISRIRYRGTRTERLCDHLPVEPHRENWQGCQMAMEVHVFEVPTDDPLVEAWRRLPASNAKQWEK